MEHNSRMKEITGNLKRDMKDLLGESANVMTGFFRRGVCTVRAVADKWKAFAHDISAAVDDLMKPPFAEGGPEAPDASLDPEGEPIVTVTESMDERFPIGKQMPLSQAEEYVRQVDQECREAERTPQAVKVKIDYVKDGRTDRYWLPLEIGAGGSLLEQMRTHIGAYQDGQARVNQLFQSVPQEYRTVLQEELTPFIHQSVDEVSRGLLPCFQRHCQAADLGKQMEEQAALLPEGEQEAFRSAVQQIMKRLHESINMGKTQEQPAVQREPPSVESPSSPQKDMAQLPQEREAEPAPRSPSVKVRLQQFRKDRKPETSAQQTQMAPPEPGRPAKSEYDARRMQWEAQERAIPKPKARAAQTAKRPGALRVERWNSRNFTAITPPSGPWT